MKKILVGCLLLIIACQSATQIPVTESAPTETPHSTPLPDSPTETLTPPTQIPATVESLPLYFTDEFTSTPSNWAFSQTGGLNPATSAFENDTLRIDISSPDTWTIGIHNAHTYSNVYLRTKANINPTGSFGLICRYDKNVGWYEFNIYSDGTYNVLYGKHLTAGVAKYIPISTDFSGHISPSAESGLHCQDNFLLLYINDNLIKRVDVTNYGLGEGQVGITASSLAEFPASIIFEWVKVSQE